MKKRILVRIDDVCEKMNEERFMEYIAFFRDMGIKPMLGVIPQCEDKNMNYGRVENFWGKIGAFAADGYIIAMHGCKHTYTMKKKGLVCSRLLSEFSGIPLKKQVSMLREGRDIMRQHGLDVRWFMAPGHSFDRNTVRALRENGFSYVSDGKARRIYMLDGMTFVPATSTWKHHWYGGILTLCLHPNTDSEHAFAEVKAYITANFKKVTTFEEVVKENSCNYRICRIEERCVMAWDRCREMIVRIIKGAA